MSTVEDHLAAIMVAEMGDVVSGERVCPPETLMREWDLSESDRRALVEWGLPLDSQDDRTSRRNPGRYSCPTWRANGNSGWYRLISACIGSST